MKKYICVAKCYELDINGTQHCIATESEIENIKNMYGDYCPCANESKWEEIKEAPETV
jgi:hypothetical protein